MTGDSPNGARAQPERYSRRTGIIETDLGAELILLDPSTEEMFSLNDVGRLIWRELGATTVETIAERVVEAFEVGHDVAVSDVRVLLDELLRAGLVVDAA